MSTGFTDPSAIPYNSAGTAVTIANSYTAIFHHSQVTDCPLVSCTIKSLGGCGFSLTSQTDINVSSISPYEMTASEINPLGWSLTFLYCCEIQPSG